MRNHREQVQTEFRQRKIMQLHVSVNINVDFINFLVFLNNLAEINPYEHLLESQINQKHHGLPLGNCVCPKQIMSCFTKSIVFILFFLSWGWRDYTLVSHPHNGRNTTELQSSWLFIKSC